MPNVGTRSDSINFFLTGASSDGGTQASDAASLGNFRSSTEIAMLGMVITSAIANLTISYASGNNGPGIGTLTAVDADDVKWTPPGGTQGAAVAIANGASAIVEGVDPSQYIRANRTSATALSGTPVVTLAEVLNNAIGGSNVSSSQASSGESTYRGIMLKNMNSITAAGVQVYIGTLGTQQVSDSAQLGSSGSGTIGTSGTFADWPASGFAQIQQSGGTLREIVYYSSRTSTVLTIPSAGRGLLGTTAAAGANTDTLNAVPGIRIAKEATSSSHIQTIANETTAPTAITWNTGITAATGLQIGDMATGSLYGVWIHRLVVAGEVAVPTMLELLKCAFDAA